jgi:acyl-coenzyme A synthetase/AMP-(fatty) acid ligase
VAKQATSVSDEGTPDAPHKGRWWEIIEKYKVSIFYTAVGGHVKIPMAAHTCHM